MNAESNSEVMRIKKTNDLIRFIESRGYTFQRQTGSHKIYGKPNANPLVIVDSREVARGTLRNVAKLIQ